MKCRKEESKPSGYKTVMYNILIFVIACISLYLVKKKPDYKYFLIILAVGMLFINISSMLRYYWYNKSLKKLEDKQRRNIVPLHCPDYWNKTHTTEGIKCDNIFINEDETTIIGDNSEPYFYLEDVAMLSNHDKCVKFSGAKMPWIDMEAKCKAAGE
jgi:hypothetical protein